MIEEVPEEIKINIPPVVTSMAGVYRAVRSGLSAGEEGEPSTSSSPLRQCVSVLRAINAERDGAAREAAAGALVAATTGLGSGLRLIGGQRAEEAAAETAAGASEAYRTLSSGVVVGAGANVDELLGGAARPDLVAAGGPPAAAADGGGLVDAVGSAVSARFEESPLLSLLHAGNLLVGGY